MRPLILTMQAFGPYAEKETIDFRKLNSHTMFVISGKTGSGKTTIFDGISYAIYGRASSEERTGSELRSDFANEDLPTEVSLLFTIRGKTYFIKRSPQQEKRKEKGEGFRLVNAKAALYAYDEKGEQKLLGSNVREVDEKIKEIMLIDSHQFRQIVMIPQGEFRKFLTSDSKEKEVILQRLFSTQIYKQIEEKLKEKTGELKRTVEKQMEMRTENLRKITVVHHEELAQLIKEEMVNDTVILPLLKEEIDWMDNELKQFSQQLKEKESEKKSLTQKIFEGGNLIKQFQTMKELKKTKESLEGQKEIFEQKEKEILLANKAALISKQEELCQRLRRELNESLQDLKLREQKMEQLTNLLLKREEVYKREKEREIERKEQLEKVHRLQQIKGEVESFSALQDEVKRLEQSLQMIKNQSQKAEENLKLAENKRKMLMEEKEKRAKTEIALLENKQQIQWLNQEIELVEKYVKQLGRLKKAELEFKKRKGLYEGKQSRLQEAKEKLFLLENRWIHGQATLLAATLQDGQPCPVCGSTEHPQPAMHSSEHIPSDEELQKVREEIAVMEKEVRNAESSFFEAQSAVNAFHTTLQEVAASIETFAHDFSESNLKPLQSELLDKRNNLLIEQQKLQQELKTLEKITDEINEIEKEFEKQKENTVQLQELLKERSIVFTEKNTRLTGVKERIPEELRSLDVFKRQLKLAIEREKEMQKQWEEAQKNLQETKQMLASQQAGFEAVKKHALEKEKELDKERVFFKEQMFSQGFTKYDEYAQAKKSEQQINQMEMEVRQYGEQLRSVTDRYYELYEQLKDVRVPNMDKLHAQMKEMDESIHKLNDDYTNLLFKRKGNVQIYEYVMKINESLKNLEEQYKLVGHLYDISRGQNALRITFERYVLAAFLDDILRAANGKLSKMTNGRYEMVRKTDRSKGNVQSGLELLVFDQYTGQTRHVKTLSGGESFKAALSLALGLAEVVQEYAGGVSLETMFIDEGFGTLDSESLEQAIEALIDIQSSGRLVGVISHVPELKERMDARLEVTATQKGSHTEFIIMNS